MPDTPALEIQDLEFSYAPADDEPPFSIRLPSLLLGRGEQVLVTAPSGGGKSTLLSLIAGLMEPVRGSVRIDGTVVHSLRGAARDHFRGRKVGMIFQTFNLLQGFTALENVSAALMMSDIPEREHRKRASELLASLGIRTPERRVERLSVGQQQRVGVARALACDPVLVLADEPTASLDPDNAAGAIDLIERACKQKNAALLCVSHDPGMRDRFQRHERLEHAGAATA
ncbi:ABC transporter ATP-binding protein YtrE [Phycisphaerales bacterium]|nr:ABC transporter ATP-binding protein YtrE [Phycisphaerales bacterium]